MRRRERGKGQRGGERESRHHVISLVEDTYTHSHTRAHTDAIQREIIKEIYNLYYVYNIDINYIHTYIDRYRHINN